MAPRDSNSDQKHKTATAIMFTWCLLAGAACAYIGTRYLVSRYQGIK